MGDQSQQTSSLNEKEEAGDNGAEGTVAGNDSQQGRAGETRGTETGVTSPEVNHEELFLTLQNAKDKADDYWNQLLRARADLENFKRRAERDLEHAHKYGLEKVAKELVPIKDSLELGLAVVGRVGENSEKIREGFELTLKIFCSLLAKMGISELDPQGQKFNPEFHQAMAMRETADKEPNTVLTVYQKGYLLNDRLIRPAMVVVSTAAQEKSVENDSNIDEMA